MGPHRHVMRAVRETRRRLNPLMDWAPWVIGGTAVVATGAAAYAIGRSSSSPAPGATAPGCPPATPASSSMWPSGSLPWAPPNAPACVPTTYGVTDNLQTVDPMFIAMAQASLNILGPQYTTAGSALTGYNQPVNGTVSSQYTAAISYMQNVLANAFTAAPSHVGTSPRIDGVLDPKTLSVLIISSAPTYSSAAPTSSASSSIVPTYFSDPTLINLAIGAIGKMLSAPSSSASSTSSTASFNAQSATKGITSAPSGINAASSSAISTFQTNFNASAGFGALLPTTGLSGGTSMDWLTWSALVYTGA
jgi:hypothetical protein